MNEVFDNYVFDKVSADETSLFLFIDVLPVEKYNGNEFLFTQ